MVILHISTGASAQTPDVTDSRERGQMQILGVESEEKRASAATTRPSLEGRTFALYASTYPGKKSWNALYAETSPLGGFYQHLLEDSLKHFGGFKGSVYAYPVKAGFGGVDRGAAHFELVKALGRIEGRVGARALDAEVYQMLAKRAGLEPTVPESEAPERVRQVSSNWRTYLKAIDKDPLAHAAWDPEVSRVLAIVNRDAGEGGVIDDALNFSDEWTRVLRTIWSRKVRSLVEDQEVRREDEPVGSVESIATTLAKNKQMATLRFAVANPALVRLIPCRLVVLSEADRDHRAHDHELEAFLTDAIPAFGEPRQDVPKEELPDSPRRSLYAELMPLPGAPRTVTELRAAFAAGAVLLAGSVEVTPAARLAVVAHGAWEALEAAGVRLPELDEALIKRKFQPGDFREDGDAVRFTLAPAEGRTLSFTVAPARDAGSKTYELTVKTADGAVVGSPVQIDSPGALLTAIGPS